VGAGAFFALASAKARRKKSAKARRKNSAKARRKKSAKKAKAPSAKEESAKYSTRFDLFLELSKSWTQTPASVCYCLDMMTAWYY
jgi:hypothetical protein